MNPNKSQIQECKTRYLKDSAELGARPKENFCNNKQRSRYQSLSRYTSESSLDTVTILTNKNEVKIKLVDKSHSKSKMSVHWMNSKRLSWKNPLKSFIQGLKSENTTTELPEILALHRDFGSAENDHKNRVPLYETDTSSIILEAQTLNELDDLSDILSGISISDITPSDEEILRKIREKKQGFESSTIFITRLELLFHRLQYLPTNLEMVEIAINGLKPAIGADMKRGIPIENLNGLRIAAQISENLLKKSEMKKCRKLRVSFEKCKSDSE